MGNILELQNIFCRYDKEDVLRGVSFSVPEGNFVGIIGPNGCGKTTLFRVITKILNPSSGSVLYLDKDIKNIPLEDLAKKIAVGLQVFSSAFSYTVEEFILMGRFPHKERFEPVNKNDFIICESAMSLTDTLDIRKRNINELSGGERQRVQIAQALAQEPRILLLDEPTTHLDIYHQVKILNLIRKLNREQSLTIVVVLHDLNLASEYCPRLILLNEGKIYKMGTPQEVLTYQNIEEVYNTVVLVKENPLSGRPYIFLVS